MTVAMNKLVELQSPYVNLGKEVAARVVPTMNLMTISGMSACEPVPRQSLTGVSASSYHALNSEGYGAVQSHLFFPMNVAACQRANLLPTKAAITSIEKLRNQVVKWKHQGFVCATIIIGTGKECKEEAIAIAEQVDLIAWEHDFPVFIELHRASITQDISTTLAIVEACPNIRFNADFSHYILSYCLDLLDSAELVEVLNRMEPIFRRVGFLHGRYASSHSIQTSTPSAWEKTVYLALVERVFSAFRRDAVKGDVLFFAPEYLPQITGYSPVTRTPQGHKEKSNRYQDAAQLIGDINQVIRYNGEYFMDHFQAMDDRLSQASRFIDSSIENKNARCDYVISIRNQQDLNKLANVPSDVTHIHVRLGSAIYSLYEWQGLIQELISWQRKDARVYLMTARNSVTHTWSHTRHLLKEFPQLRLSLNISEWLLGEEIRVDKLRSFKKRVVTLAPNIADVVPVFSTAEHAYKNTVEYKAPAFVSPSVWVEHFYSKFFNEMNQLLTRR